MGGEMTDRAKKKKEYQAFRNKARKLYNKDHIKISETATVWPMEEGAFVEASIWIPRELIDESSESS